MTSVDTQRPSISRRSFLGGMAGLAGVRNFPSSRTAAPALTVMTRNLYVGVDLFDLFRVSSFSDFQATAGDMIEAVQSHPFSARMDAIAGEIEAAQPDIVGIQEAVLVRTQKPSDFMVNPAPNATEEVIDLLELLTSKLDDRGLDYEVAASSVTSDIEIPAEIDGEGIDVRVTDRTAILVHEDLETNDTRTGKFDKAYSISINGVDLRPLHRGYCSVDLDVDGTELTMVTTHLESADAGVRLEQADELLGRLPTDRPVILTGDFNSGPGASSEAYDLLTQSLSDTHTSLYPDSDGYTCCHSADLQNEESRLSFRIDAILYRGGVRPTASDLLGEDPTDRVEVTSDDQTVRIWPSDHAGIVATFEVAAVAAPSTEASSREPSPTVRFDGLESVMALGAAIIGALAWRYRRR